MTTATGERMAFGPYMLLGEVARGGMAEVQFATRQSEPSGPLLALKRILPEYRDNAHYRRCFDAEVELAAALHHPNVVATIDSGVIDGQPFLAMEYLHGRSLNRLLHSVRVQGRRLPVPHAAFIACEILAGLDYVHHATDAQGRPLNAVFCDLSPSNVLVGWSGAVKLIDFGISTSRARFSEQIGMIKGKKSYMPPEQLQGLPLDGRADVFAMGLCLFELVTGEAAFAQRTEFEIEQALRTEPYALLAPRLGEVPRALASALERAVAASPADRFPDAAAFAQALRPLARLGDDAAVTPAALARLLELYAAAQKAHDDARIERLFPRADG